MGTPAGPLGFAAGFRGDNPRVKQLAELSSVATALEELLHRVTAIAETVEGTDRDAVTTELFEVERTLGAAHRRLIRLIDRYDQAPH